VSIRPLSETDAAVAWLRQFELRDQLTASALLDAMVLVSRDEFSERISDLVLDRSARVNGPVGLYAEREIRKYRGLPNRLFKETVASPRRAYGSGPSPVKPTRTIGPEVGSEGIVAQLITELCRMDPRKFRSHPGPDEIRREHVAAFFLISDFIGSGDRVCSYLEAAWRIASVKSWRSLGLMRFEIIVYSAVDQGLRRVRKHRSKPEVNMVVPCPTISSIFNDRDRVAAAMAVCIRYDPIDRDRVESLGYGGAGALIAFAHGCPNNVPRILRSRGRRWTPLFRGSVTRGARGLFGEHRDERSLTHRLERLGERRLARGAWLRRTTREGHAVIGFLAAVRRGPRRDDTIARRTGLTLPEVGALVARITALGWIDARRRLTDAGQRQLKRARDTSEPRAVLASEPKAPYYPTSLRAPRPV
jgi:hypothetical protein